MQNSTHQKCTIDLSLGLRAIRLDDEEEDEEDDEDEDLRSSFSIAVWKELSVSIPGYNGGVEMMKEVLENGMLGVI